MSAGNTVEHRLGRARALMIAMAAVAERRDGMVPDVGTCVYLEIMAGEELDKVVAVLGAETLNRDC